MLGGVEVGLARVCYELAELGVAESKVASGHGDQEAQVSHDALVQPLQRRVDVFRGVRLG
eukprot:1681134-Rhodomonas_salina.1